MAPEFVAVNSGMVPVPDAARPIAVLELVQVKVHPETGLVNVSAGISSPLHTEKLDGTTTVGVGLTVMV